MADRACADCKRIVEKGSECPICKGTDLTRNWQGIAVIYEPEHSAIAEQIGVSTAGKYAIRVNV